MVPRHVRTHPSIPSGGIRVLQSSYYLILEISSWGTGLYIQFLLAYICLCLSGNKTSFYRDTKLNLTQVFHFPLDAEP